VFLIFKGKKRTPVDPIFPLGYFNPTGIVLTASYFIAFGSSKFLLLNPAYP
jgi:hypothetical protein